MNPTPLPYPFYLQHRQRAPHICHAVNATIDESLPVCHGNDPSYLQEQLLRVKLLEDRARMRATAQKRRTLATEVVSSSGVPLPRVPTPVKKGEPPLDIFHAAVDGDARMVDINIAAGVDVDAVGQPHPQRYDGVQFEKRWTFAGPPLVFAAAFGRERCVRCLLQRGADPFVASSTGWTAKQYAWERNYVAIFEMLKEAEIAKILRDENRLRE